VDIYITKFRKLFVTEAENQLKSTANLKKEEISNWRSERLRGAEIFYKTSLSVVVRQYFENQMT